MCKEVSIMLDLELMWLEWTAGREGPTYISLALFGLVLALTAYVLALVMRLRISQEIFGSLRVFGPPLFSIKEVGCALLAALVVVVVVPLGLWLFVLR
jgi:hypothetical protein